jgi:hypothetical protein
MADVQLGALERLDAREVWKDEGRDFTPWLRDNIHLLAEALGLEIDADVQREVPVGLFSADLLGSELGSGATILVENQLEATDHGHLGQLLTYAGGLDARVLVWVAPTFRDEHRQALLWLNEHTEGDVRFFAVEVELVRIGGSLPAPNFRVVVAPTEWGKTLTGRGSVARGMSPERVERYRAFFRDFLAAVLTREPHATTASPESVGRDPWFVLALGRSGFTVTFDFGWDGPQKVVRVNFFIETRHKEQNEAFFDLLLPQREQIEAEFGEPLVWNRREDIKRCHVYMSRPGSIDDPPEALAELREWGVQRLLRLREIMAPRVRALQPGQAAPARGVTEPSDL